MKKTLLALVAGVVSMGAAQADTISYDFGMPVTLSTTEITVTGSLGLFDSTLGTLTGATLTLASGASFSFTGTNTAAQSQLANITSSTDIFWSSSLGALDLSGSTQSLSASSGAQNYAIGQTRSFGPIADDASDSMSLASILASLQAAGGGTFDLTCQSLSGLAVQGGGGNISTTQSTEAGCGAMIEYTYDAAPPPSAPEPASLALVGLALAGVAAARRKA